MSHHVGVDVTILEGTTAMVATQPRRVLLGAQPQRSHLEGGRIEDQPATFVGTEVKSTRERR